MKPLCRRWPAKAILYGVAPALPFLPIQVWTRRPTNLTLDVIRRPSDQQVGILLCCTFYRCPGNGAPSPQFFNGTRRGRLGLAYRGVLGLCANKRETPDRRLPFSRQVCSSREEGRRQVIQTEVLQHIIGCLTDAQSRVRLAAAQCARSLSRSVKVSILCTWARFSQLAVPSCDGSSERWRCPAEPPHHVSGCRASNPSICSD